MLEDFRLIIDLVSILAAAAVGGVAAGLAGLPPLLGYIVGGVIVGPTGLGLIKELIQVETLAQFGAAFLLFALGVEFSFSELKKVQKISLGGGGLQILLTILITTIISVSVGWVTTPQQGVFLGAILSLSSTAVVLKSLMEANETATSHGQVMLGILVVQDLALGFMLAVLPALDRPAEEIGLAVVQAAIKIGLFAVVATLTGIFVVPRARAVVGRSTHPQCGSPAVAGPGQHEPGGARRHARARPCGRRQLQAPRDLGGIDARRPSPGSSAQA